MAKRQIPTVFTPPAPPPPAPDSPPRLDLDEDDATPVPPPAVKMVEAPAPDPKAAEIAAVRKALDAIGDPEAALQEYADKLSLARVNRKKMIDDLDRAVGAMESELRRMGKKASADLDSRRLLQAKLESLTASK